MKKIRMIIALMIAMVVMFISVSTAFASSDPDEKIKELENCIYDVATEFNMYIPNFTVSIDGEVFLDYTNETYLNLNSVLNQAAAFVDEYYNNEDIIEEQIEEHITAIEKAYGEMVLEKSELEFLVTYCQFETNDGYYGNDVWSNFTNNLDVAETVLADESIVDTRVTDAFWSLFESYNQLCLYNDIKGDVDYDGVVSILDSTYIQRYLADLSDMNSSQKFIGCVVGYSKITVLDATELQRYLVSLRDNTNWCYAYNKLTINTDLKDIKSNMLFYDALVEERFGPWF